MRKFISVFLVVMMIVSSASFAFADDVSLQGTQNQTNNQAQNVGQNVGVTTTLSPTMNSSMNSTNNNNSWSNSTSGSSSTSGAESNATGGDARATGGKSILNFNYNNPRNFLNGIGSYQVGLIGGPDTNGHRRSAQAAAFRLRMRMNQVSFDSMKNYLVEANKIDSSTRDWEDLRDDLVVQPKFNFPRAALSDQEFVFVVDAASINFANINEEDVVGFVTVRDKKPRENSVDKMYMVDAIYPYAKIGGANLLIKVDDYFWVKVKSGSWGAGLGGIFSAIFSCFTGGAGSVNGGYSSGSSMEHVAGGEMYMALRISEKPCPPPAPKPCPPPEVKQPPPPQACNPKEFLLKLERIDLEIFGCKRYGHNNLYWQLEAMKESLNVYLCTGNVIYLEDAIQHGQMAELNYIHGYDIAKHADSDKIVGEVEYLLASAFYARDSSINNFWKAPAHVVHVDKKRGNSKPVALTVHEKKQVEKLRCTLERYSKKLAL